MESLIIEFIIFVPLLIIEFDIVELVIWQFAWIATFGPSCESMTTDDELRSLGWRPHFAAQLEYPDDSTLKIARVLAVHRGRIDIAGQGTSTFVNLTGKSASIGITVGDWVLIDETGRLMTELWSLHGQGQD